MKSILIPENYEECLNRINSISSDNKGLWGTMNANQMLCHCADQIRMAYGEIKPKDHSNFITRSIAKYLVLFGMPAPKGKIETAKEIKQGEMGTECVGIAEDKKMLKDLIEHFINNVSENDCAIHPAFGKLNYKQWCRLIYIHLDHHLKQFNV